MPAFHRWLFAWVVTLGAALWAALTWFPDAVPGPPSEAAPNRTAASAADRPEVKSQPSITEEFAESIAAMPPAEGRLATTYLQEIERLGGRYGKDTPELRALRKRYVAAAAPNPFRTGAISHLAAGARRRGEIDEAIRLYELLAAQDNDKAREAVVQVAKILLAEGDPEAARRRLKAGPVFRAGELKSPNDVQVNAERADLFRQLGDHEAARLAYLEGSPDPASDETVQSYLTYGMWVSGGIELTGHSAEAVNFQRTLLKLYGDRMSGDHLRGIAQSLELTGDEEAAEALRALVKAKHPRSRAASGLLLQETDAAIQRRDWTLAELLARQAVEASAGHPANLEMAEDMLRRALDPSGYDPGTEGGGGMVPTPDPAFSALPAGLGDGSD